MITNNDIFKKLRVALQLRDDEIIEILTLVDFNISKGEIGNFFRDDKHEKFVECGDQVLRNFLNGLIIHLRGTKENPKNAKDTLNKHYETVAKRIKTERSSNNEDRDRGDRKPSSFSKPKTNSKPAFKSNDRKPKTEGTKSYKSKDKPTPKVNLDIKFSNGKKKK